MITGYLDGIGGGGVFTDSLNRFKLRALNGTVLQLYRAAARYTGEGALAHPNRCIPQFDRLQVLPAADVPAYAPAARNRYYCYELIVPPALKAQAGRLMLDDLNRFFSGPATSFTQPLKNGRSDAGRSNKTAPPKSCSPKARPRKLLPALRTCWFTANSPSGGFTWRWPASTKMTPAR